MTEGNGKSTHRVFRLAFSCPCGNAADVKIEAKPGVTAAQLPMLHCTMCDTLPPMQRVKCEKIEASGLVLPTMVPPLGVGVKT